MSADELTIDVLQALAFTRDPDTGWARYSHIEDRWSGEMRALSAALVDAISRGLVEEDGRYYRLTDAGMALLRQAQAGEVTELIKQQTGATSAIVVDGNADAVVAAMVEAGWTLADSQGLVAGKRVRVMVPPTEVADRFGLGKVQPGSGELTDQYLIDRAIHDDHAVDREEYRDGD
jgi:hypothetical protein